MDGVDDAVSSSLKAAAEGMVLSVVVVVSHVRSPSWRIDGFPSSLFYSDLFTRCSRRINGGPSFLETDFGARVTVTGRVDGGARGLLFDLDLCGASVEVLRRTAETRGGISLFELANGRVLTETGVGVSLYKLAIVVSCERPCSLAVAAFSLVEYRLLIAASEASDGASFAVVGTFLCVGLVFDVDLGVDVLAIRFTVALGIVSTCREVN